MSNALIANQKEQIKELIDTSSSIGIVVSENQNIDTVAAALGLYLVLKSNGKNVQVVSKKTPAVEVSNLVGVDKILKSFSGNTKILTISVPYREGEIEKVSYNIEDTRLNVNLFAESSGITFDESEVQYIRKGSSPSLAITIGIANENELSNLIDLKETKTIHLDKNPLNSLFGGISIIDPSFSSLSEIVTQLVMEANLGYDLDAFQNLLDGITFATRNFTSQNTSPYAFEAAGFLLQNGAKRKGGRQGKPFESVQDKPDDRFPREEQFLHKRPQPRPFDQTARPNWPRPVLNPTTSNAPASTPPFDSAQGKQDPFAIQRAKSFQDTSKPIEEIESVEGAGTGEVPDDWFLPKVFKGSRKGN